MCRLDHQRLTHLPPLWRGRCCAAFFCSPAQAESARKKERIGIDGSSHTEEVNDIVWQAQEELDWYFRRMVRKFVKERDKVSVEGISLPGLLVLHKIEREGEQKLSDLGEQLDFTSGAVTGICDKLEAKGLAVRKPKPNDRRTVLLTITDEGRAFLERYAGVGERCITLLFDGFTPEELAAQSDYYQRIAANLERFSETILQLAEDVGQGVPQQAPGQTAEQEKPKRRDNRSPFISY